MTSEAHARSRTRAARVRRNADDGSLWIKFIFAETTYREAVATSSPGLPARLPWVSNSIRRNPDGVASYP